ncbi:MAG: ABC transporter permease/M1 family aminopeptidase [Calditrichaceae bacterium]
MELTMFFKILIFNLKYQSRQVTFYAAALLFFALGILSSQANFGGIDVHVNSPYAIAYFQSLLSLFLLFPLTLFVVNLALRDSTYKMEELVFSTPVTRFNYLGGIFTALLLSNFIILILAALGMYLGSFLVEAGRLGPVNIGNYLRPLIIFGVPNILFSSSVLFAVAILSRNTLATYVSGVSIYILYMVASILGNSPLMASATLTGSETKLLPVLMDPYGLVGYLGMVKNWIPMEKNSLSLSVGGNFLINRVFWLTISALIFTFVYRIFEFRVLTGSSKKERTSTLESETLSVYRPMPVYPQSRRAQLQAFTSATYLEVISNLKSIPLLLLMLLWIFLVGIELTETILHGVFDTVYYPTTGFITTIIHAPLTKIGIFIVIFYGAEMVTREKAVNINEIVDALPLPSSIIYFSKFVTLIILIMLFIVAAIVTGIFVQALNGYFRFEMDIYLSLFYYGLYPLALVAVVALFITAVIPNKYIAMLLTGVWFLFTMKKTSFGPEHPLLRYAMAPNLVYSDMSGFGQPAGSFHWLMIFWTGVAGILVLATWRLWPRGTDNGLRFRLESFFKDWKSGHVIAGITCLAIVLGSGASVFYQTNVLNVYRTQNEQTRLRAEYEKKYKSFVSMSTPVITDVRTRVDLYPTEARYRIEGRYTIQNQTNEPLTDFLIGVHHEVTRSEITFKNTILLHYDDTYHYYQFRAERPMLPGEKRELKFLIDMRKSGFQPVNYENSVVKNGSYIELEKFVPFFGYNADFELNDRIKRGKMGLPQQSGSADLEGDFQRTYQWINFETIISSEANQTVVTIGTLQKQWRENGRDYFHYKTERPVPFMFACTSAEFARKQETVGDVALEIYYHPEHSANVVGLLEAAKQSLDIFEDEFGPYQYKQLVIAEIPNYPGAATAYPNLLFFREKYGFLGNVSDTSKINFVAHMLAHELSHQWWAGQLEPADVEGGKVLTETLAQYSEILMFEKTFGRNHLRQYLGNELKAYLTGRSYSLTESPLYRSGGREQTHIYYQKGSLVMYALKELLGEEKLNTAVRNLLKAHAWPGEQATTHDLLSALYAVANNDQSALIDDWMKKIVFYDLRIESAQYKILPDGRYEVSMLVNTTKSELRGDREVIPMIMNESIDIGIFSDHPDAPDFQQHLILLEKHLFTQERTRLSFIVERKPGAVCIDPFSYLIDQNVTDNVFIPDSQIEN